MPKSDNQKAKILALYQILHDYTDKNNGLSMSEIIARLKSDYDINAERRSISSDLATLETVFHIEVEPRKSDITRYYLRTRTFSLSDIMILEHSIEANNLITGAAARELIQKLKSLCSVYEGKQIQTQANLSDYIRGMDEDLREKVSIIQKAIETDAKISFQYPQFNFSKDTRPQYSKTNIYLISPLSITYSMGHYYLFAYTGKPHSTDNEEKSNYHFFYLDKMDSIKIFPYKKREGKERFEAMDAVDNRASAYPSYGGTIETVSIKFSNDLTAAVQDHFGANIEINIIDDNYFRIVTAADITPEFFGWLFSLGTGVHLLTPLHVTQKFKKWLKNVYEIYYNRN